MGERHPRQLEPGLTLEAQEQISMVRQVMLVGERMVTLRLTAQNLPLVRQFPFSQRRDHLVLRPPQLLALDASLGVEFS